MKCNECGAEFEYKSDYCPFCGSNLPSGYQNTASVSSGFINREEGSNYTPPVAPESLYSMTWYKFLVNFVLWFSVASNIYSAYLFYTGSVYENFADQIYKMLPELQNLDLFATVYSALAAILSIAVLFSLKGYKKYGPTLLILLYLANVGFYLIYMISFGSILSGAESTILYGDKFVQNGYMYQYQLDLTQVNLSMSYILPVISGILMTIINGIYFRNRKDLFVN